MSKIDIERARELLNPPIVSVPTVGKALGIGQRRAYEAAKLGQLQTVPIGRQVVVLTAPIKRLLGLESVSSTDSPTRLEGDDI